MQYSLEEEVMEIVKEEQMARDGKNLMLYNIKFWHVLIFFFPYVCVRKEKNAQLGHVYLGGLKQVRALGLMRYPIVTAVKYT